MDGIGKTYVAGHRGMVGSALLRALEAHAGDGLLVRGRTELDLTRQSEVEAFFADGTPRKLLDVGRLRQLGWEASIGLRDGVRQTRGWMSAHWREITAG